MKAGDSFGEAGLAGRARHATALSVSPTRLARLDRDRFLALAEREPPLALRFLEAVVGELGTELGGIADRIGQALRERTLPRRTQIRVRLGGVERWVNTGTPLRDVLPADVDGRPVVAALLDNKAVSLSSPLTADADLGLLTTDHWEGQEIYRRSAGLLLLEAAHLEFPRTSVRMGPTMGSGDRVELGGEVPPTTLLIERLLARMHELTRADAPFRTELWTVEEACSHFAEEGWGDAARLLRAWRDATVPLVSCGELYALATGPFLASAGAIREFGLHARDDGLRLTYGEQVPVRGGPSATGGSIARRSPMAKEHDRWLASMGVGSVGAFNDQCVSGQVANLIRVAEGFHEKQIGQIADTVRSRADRVRVITIAGPSSSGKTTFIKRLTVQLQIDGLNPLSLSLDDYYVDRERTVRDEAGEYDFEALDALDLDRLGDNLSGLIAGEAVQLPHYNFKAGKQEEGEVIQLGPEHIIILEGIHGLDPKLVPAAVAKKAYRIYVSALTQLNLDRHNRVSTTDTRLIRRIVRDTRERGCRRIV
jgi:uridine kinase